MSTLSLRELEAEHKEHRRAILEQALVEAGWSIRKAAMSLGIPYGTLQYLLESYPQLHSLARDLGPKSGRKSRSVDTLSKTHEFHDLPPDILSKNR